MDKLRSLFTPALLSTCLSLAGCTGINPFNWASTDMPCCHHDGCSSCDSPMMPGEYEEYHGGPLLGSRQHGLLSRGILREHWNLARSFEESGDTEQAAAHYEKILSVQPDYAPAHHRLGILATMWGRFGDADEHFRLARRAPAPETVTEESYVDGNLTSEREAEARIQREIAAEQAISKREFAAQQGVAEQEMGAEQGITHQTMASRPIRRRFQIGARIADAYYAQQEKLRPSSVVVSPERSVPQQRVAGRSQPAETITTTRPASAKSGLPQASNSSTSTKYYEKAARTQPRQAFKEYFAGSEEEIEEESEIDSEIEDRSTSQDSPVSSSPQAKLQPTASSVRPATDQAPLSRSAQVRENSLRAKKVELPEAVLEETEVAQESTEWQARERVVDSRAAATSGIRRISNQEPETFAAEERYYAATIKRLSAVREREKAAQAELQEAEVEARVAQELEISLAERRLKLARAQLRLAQQQLNSAIEAAGGEMPDASREVPAQAIEFLDDADLERSSEKQLPAPRRLRTHETSAVEPEGKDFLAEVLEEPQTFADESALEVAEIEGSNHDGIESLISMKKQGAEQAGANIPAEAPGVCVAQLAAAIEQVEVEPAIELAGHDEEAEPAEFEESAAVEIRQENPVTETENATVRARHTLKRVQHLPDARAHQPEQPIRTLDEQTLSRREVSTRPTFSKKSPALPPTILYR